MAHVVVIGPARSLEQFRGDLIRTLIGDGHRVTAMYAESDPDTINRVRALGAEFQNFHIRRNQLAPLDDFRTVLALRRAFLALQPDVVLAYTVKAVVGAGFALRAFPQTRFVALVNGLGFSFQGRGVLRRGLTGTVTRLYRAALLRAAAVIFQNPDNRDTFISRGIVPAMRCHVVNGSGVNLAHFSQVPLSGGPPVFLLVARLLGEKGLREFAECARLVKARYPSAVFRILGGEDPSPDAVPITEVRAWQEAGWIEYLGSALDVRPALTACHVFVLPSYHEGLPRAVLEAMAIGRPIVTTDVPGCRETVQPGENGYLVPKADASALADRLCSMIEQRADWPRLAEASRRIVAERFDVREVNADMIRIMDLDRSRG